MKKLYTVFLVMDGKEYEIQTTDGTFWTVDEIKLEMKKFIKYKSVDWVELRTGEYLCIPEDKFTQGKVHFIARRVRKWWIF